MNKQLKALTMERRLIAKRLAVLAGKEPEPDTEEPAVAPVRRKNLTHSEKAIKRLKKTLDCVTPGAIAPATT